MSFNEILFGSSGILIILLTLVQITPIKINPWSAILKWIGKQTQAETIKKIDDLMEQYEQICNELFQSDKMQKQAMSLQ